MKKCIAVLLAVLFCSTVYAENLRTGFARRDITPDAEDIKNGIITHGWSAAGLSDKVQDGDNLYVRAMAMRDKNDTLLVILAADTCKIHPGDVYLLQEWFEQTFGVDRWNLVMNSSHTHQAPATYLPSYGRNPYIETYHKMFIEAVKSSIIEAVENAVTPMKIKYANLQINEDMVYNKNQRLAEKNPEFGKIDTDFPVFIFMDAETDKIAGFLWSVAAHPTYIGSGGLRYGRGSDIIGGPEISSHAPGAVARALKQKYGRDITCMFAQGAAGDTKMKFPEFAGKISWRRLRDKETETSKAITGYFWIQGEREGEVLTQEEYLKALANYADIYVDIIESGLQEGKFAYVDDIELKTAGKDAKIKIAPDARPRRPEGTVADYQKIIDDENSSMEEKFRAYEALYLIYDDEHAGYSWAFAKVAFNNELQIATMSGEVCCEIGLDVKEYYRERGIETVFFGYGPVGGTYYPSNLNKEYTTYQSKNLNPPKGFDFDSFAMETFKSLTPK